MQIESVASKIQDIRSKHDRTCQKEILDQLYELRKTMQEEAEESGPAASNKEGDAEYQDLKAKYEKLSEDFKALEEKSQSKEAAMNKEISKLNYRVEILKKNIKID